MFCRSATQVRPVPAKITLVLAAILAMLSSGAAVAGTTTSTFQVQVTVQASCTIVSSPTLDFGTQGVFAANVDQSSIIQVQCTNTTPYDIGLNAGTGSGATVATRKMTSGGATVNYSLYTNAARTIVWGNTVGTDTVSATGNGAGQSYTVYGRIPPQTTPAPATYADTITLTLTY
jgi:spore coat protein U-like protein